MLAIIDDRTAYGQGVAEEFAKAVKASGGAIADTQFTTDKATDFTAILTAVKAKKPGMQIAVGGCLAQKDRATITTKAPWVDVVFGTHNIGSLPALLERARVQEEAQVEILESLEVFPSTLPTKRESAYAAWV